MFAKSCSSLGFSDGRSPRFHGECLIVSAARTRPDVADATPQEAHGDSILDPFVPGPRITSPVRFLRSSTTTLQQGLLFFFGCRKTAPGLLEHPKRCTTPSSGLTAIARPGTQSSRSHPSQGPPQPLGMRPFRLGARPGLPVIMAKKFSLWFARKGSRSGFQACWCMLNQQGRIILTTTPGPCSRLRRG